MAIYTRAISYIDGNHNPIGFWKRDNGTTKLENPKLCIFLYCLQETFLFFSLPFSSLSCIDDRIRTIYLFAKRPHFQYLQRPEYIRLRSSTLLIFSFRRLEDNNFPNKITSFPIAKNITSLKKIHMKFRENIITEYSSIFKYMPVEIDMKF